MFSQIACDRNQIDVCLDEDATIAVSPSGRAIAVIDPQAYESILKAPSSARPNLNCAADGYVSRFEARPEALIFVLNIEDRFITRARLMEERGFRLFRDLFGDLTDDDIRAYGEAEQDVQKAMEELPFPPVAAFNGTYQSLEAGVGDGASVSCSNACSDFLRGYIFLPTRDNLVAGRFLHEFAHFWAAHLTGPTVLANQIESYGHHWGFTSVGGVLGGWRPDSLEERPNGRFAGNVAPRGRATNQIRYAPLELYLMGLTPPSEVDSIKVAVGVSDIVDEGEGILSFHVERLDTVTIQEIVETNGSRVPSFEDSPKEFHVGLVIIASHSLSESDWGYYESAMNFLEAGDGVDLLEVFSESAYPAQYEVWSFLSSGGNEPYLNFARMTGGRGSLRFVPIH